MKQVLIKPLLNLVTDTIAYGFEQADKGYNSSGTYPCGQAESQYMQDVVGWALDPQQYDVCYSQCDYQDHPFHVRDGDVLDTIYDCSAY